VSPYAREFLEMVEAAAERLGFPEPARHGNLDRKQSGEGVPAVTIAPSTSGEEF